MKPMVIFILLVFVLFVFMLFILRLTVGVSYTLSNNTQKLVLTFYFFRQRLVKSLQLYPKRAVTEKDKKKNARSNYIKRKLAKAEAKLKEQSKSLKPNAIIKLLNDLKQIYFKKIRSILRKAIVIIDFRLKLEEGTGDACQTALLYGFLWNIVGVITSTLFNEFKTENKKIDITTNFNERTIKADFNCILSVKIGNIILVGIIFLKWLIKNIKGGDKFVKSSNRRTYDNCNAKHQGNG